MNKIPVHIITGFLGAGKTTFLNHLIRSTLPERMMVIENEVGKVNIDSQLVIDTESDVMELTAGCLCCSLNDELLDLLEEVSYRRDEFDRLIIETTGVADPETIVLPFLASRGVERVFDLKNVTCLVDSSNIEEWLKEAEEARRQIAFADTILINKQDLVDEDQMAQLKDLLSKINPHANVYIGQNGQFPVQEILHIEQIQEAGAVEKTEQIQAHHKHNKHGISTFTLHFDGAFDLNGLGHELMRMLNFNRHQIYRIKGILNTKDYPSQVVLQSVKNTFHLSDGKTWEPGQARESKIVVIGKNLKKEAMEKIFRRHHTEVSKV